MTKVAIALIKLYQLIFSPDHSWRKIYYPYGFCPYHPTCSQYALESLAVKGFWAGLWAAARRVWQCRPGKTGGYDPVKI